MCAGKKRGVRDKFKKKTKWRGGVRNRGLPGRKPPQIERKKPLKGVETRKNEQQTQKKKRESKG